MPRRKEDGLLVSLLMGMSVGSLMGLSIESPTGLSAEPLATAPTEPLTYPLTEPFTEPFTPSTPLTPPTRHFLSHSSDTPVNNRNTKQSTYNEPFDDGVAITNRRQPSDKPPTQLATWDPNLSTTWTQRHPEKLHRRPTANQMTRHRHSLPAQ